MVIAVYLPVARFTDFDTPWCVEPQVYQIKLIHQEQERLEKQIIGERQINPNEEGD